MKLSIVRKIALIAKLNNIDDVTTYHLRAGQSLIVEARHSGGGAITSGDGAVSGGGRGASILGSSSIKIKPEPDLDDYNPEELTGEDDGVYKHTKDGADDIYSTYVDQLNVWIYGASAEEVKKLKSDIEEKLGQIEAMPSDETDDEMAARLANNFKIIKEIAQMSGYDKEVVVGLVEGYFGPQFLDTNSKEYNTFVQELIKNLDVDIIEELLSLDGFGEGEDASLDEKFNQKTYETFCKLYQGIIAKERSGAILTDEEVALKEKLNVLANTNHAFIVRDDEGSEKYRMEYGYNANRICYYQRYGEYDIEAFTPKLLEEIGTKLAADGANAAEIFKEYKNTKDAVLAQTLLELSTTMGADKQDIIDLINSNDMYVIKVLPIDDLDMSNDDQKAIVEAAIARIRDIYTNLQKGDPNNMRYLADANAIIDKLANSLPDGDEKNEILAIKVELLESYFTKTVTGEGEDAVTTYTYTGKRRMSKEEAEVFYSLSTSNMDHAIIETLTLEDFGSNGIAQNYAVYDELTARCEELFENVTTASEALDFISKISIESVIPFDKILEKFGDSDEVITELAKKFPIGSVLLSEDSCKTLIGRFLVKDWDNSVKEPFELDTEAIESAGIENAKLIAIAMHTGDGKSSYLKLFKDTLINDFGTYFERYPDLFKYNADSDLWDSDNWDAIFQKANGGYYTYQAQMLNDGYQNDRYHSVKAGDNWTKILTEYVKKQRPGLTDDQRKRYVDRIIRNTSLPDLHINDGNSTRHSSLDGEYVNVVDFDLLNLDYFDGLRLGAALHKEVKGGGSGNAITYLTTGLEGITINEDTVVGVILGFNTGGDGKHQHIIDFLDDENGSSINRTHMNTIPKALLEYAYAHDYENSDEYTALQNYVNEVGDSDSDDFESHDAAKKMDYLMIKLLQKMGKNATLNDDEKKKFES